MTSFLSRFRYLFKLNLYVVSCYAGETLHFYEEVYEHGKIPEDDTIRRIYMARHIMEKFIVAGLLFIHLFINLSQVLSV